MNIQLGLVILFVCASIEGCVNVLSLGGDSSFLGSDINIIKSDDRLIEYETLLDTINRILSNYVVSNISDICPGGVRGLIEATKLFPDKYIINLNVADFYKFNQNEVFQYLSYIGETDTILHSVEACRVDFKGTDVKVNCNETSHQYPAVKLMTNNIDNHDTLRDIIYNYPAIPERKKILVCDKHDLQIDDKFDFTIVKSRDCDDAINEKDLVAVVAPRPLDADILVPIVLYQTPCFQKFNPDNIVTLTPCDDYKYALLEFLTHSGWSRVAIVSDDAAHSENFEEEMITLFEEHGFTYIVVRCQFDAHGCNFDGALKTLIDSDARVVIANLNEENASKLTMRLPMDLQMKSSWIFREFTASSKDSVDVYSLSLAPTINERIIYKRKSILSNNVNAALHRIQKAYRKLKNKIPEEGRHFSRKLANRIQSMTNRNSVTAYVTNAHKVILTIKGGEVIQHSPYTPRRDMNECNLKSRNFHSPCDENNVLIILMALVSVAICVLVTIIYTNRLEKNRQYTMFT